MNFSGKIAIVTGGTRGIGKSISRALLEAGMKLLICNIKKSSAKSFLEELPTNLRANVVYQKCDVSSFEDMKSAFEKTKSTYGRIDVVINNAGIMNESQWEKTIEVNFIGVIHGIHLAFEYMGKNKGGSGGFVVNTGSSKGLNGFDLAPIYSATKHAVVGLTKSFGTPYHFDQTGVTVNSVCPAAVDTPLYHVFPGLTLDEERGKQLASTLVTVSSDEVAKAVMQLLQDGKNGAIISVDSEKGIRYEE